MYYILPKIKSVVREIRMKATVTTDTVKNIDIESLLNHGLLHKNLLVI
jgi:hypothetical protein